MTFKKHLSGTQFELELVKAVLPIVTSHMKIAIDDRNAIYDELGTEREKHLKRIQKHYGNLNTVISDLDLVKGFLNIKDRSQIKLNYPNLESQEEYYKYHFENFIIRLVTLSDIIGKMGNEIFETGIDPNKCNGYNFKEKIKSDNPEIALIVEKLLLKVKDIKDKRHQKIHKGETDISQLNKIVFWDELQEIVGAKKDPILDELTENNIKEEIEKLVKEVKDVIDVIKEFLEEAKGKIEEIDKYPSFELKPLEKQFEEETRERAWVPKFHKEKKEYHYYMNKKYSAWVKDKRDRGEK